MQDGGVREEEGEQPNRWYPNTWLLSIDSFIHIDAPPSRFFQLALFEWKLIRIFFASIPLFHRSSCRFQSSSAAFAMEMKNNFIFGFKSFSLFLAATHGHCCWQKKSTTGMSNGIRNVALFISRCAIHMGCWLCFALSSLSPRPAVEKKVRKAKNAKKTRMKYQKINRGWKPRWKVKKHKSKFALPSSSSSTAHGREEKN